eukprot:320578_1
MFKTPTPEQKEVDLVHPLDSKQRISHLVYGYMRFYYDFNQNIFIRYHTPDAIIKMCLNYIDSMYIVSQTEQESLKQASKDYKVLLKRSNESAKHYETKFGYDSQDTTKVNDLRIIVLGYAGSGKSNVCIRYVCNEFVDEWEPYNEEYYRILVEVEGSAWYLEIYDTSSYESEFASMTHTYYRCGNVFIFVYDITNKNSFDNISKYIMKVQNAFKWDDEHFFGIIVGNKCDICDNNPEKRQISTEQGMNLACTYGNLLFYETSAKKNINIKEIFQQCVRLWMHHKLLYESNHYKQTITDQCCY